jgi:hypothetical protein
MFPTKFATKKIKTNVNVQYFFFFENDAVYEVHRKTFNRAKQAADENIQRRRFSCRLAKATNTH